MLSEKTFQDLKNVVDADGISICQFLNRYYSKISPYIPITSIHVEDVDRLLHACQTLELKSVKVLKKENNIVTATETGTGLGPLAGFLNGSLFEPTALQEKLVSMSDSELKTNLWAENRAIQSKKDLSKLPEVDAIVNLIKNRFTIVKEKNYPMFPSILDLLISKWIQTKEITKNEAKQLEKFILTNCFLPPSHIPNLPNPLVTEQVRAYFTQDLSLNIGIINSDSSIPLVKKCPDLLPWNKWTTVDSGNAAKKMKNWMTIDYRAVLYRLSQVKENKDKVSGLIIGYTLPHLFTRLTSFLACSKFGYLTKNNDHVTMLFASVISEIFRRRVIVLSSANIGAFMSSGPYSGSSGGYSGSVLVDFTSPELEDSVSSQVDFSHTDTTLEENTNSTIQYTFDRSKNRWKFISDSHAEEEKMSSKIVRLLRLLYQGNPLSPDSCIQGDYPMAFPALNRVQYAYADPYLHCTTNSEVGRSTCVNNAFILTNSLARIIKSHVVKHIDTDPNCFKKSENANALVSGCYPYIFYHPVTFDSIEFRRKELPSNIDFQASGMRTECCEYTYQNSTKAAFFFTTLLSYSWCENHKDEVEKIKSELKTLVNQTLIQPRYFKQAQSRISVEALSAHQLKREYLLHDMEACIKKTLASGFYYAPVAPKENGTVSFVVVIPKEQLTSFLCESYLHYDEKMKDDAIIPTLGYEDDSAFEIIGWKPKAMLSPDVSIRKEKTEPLIALQELEGTPEDYSLCNQLIQKESM